MCVFFCLFFFFKQKTAYEMRISDWSSDVCSSDLKSAAVRLRADGHNVIETREPGGTPLAENLRAMILNADNDMDTTTQLLLLNAARRSHIQQVILPNIRSEEHTSELQSLMRISYAVFCLKKKKNNNYNQ